ncbi:MAG: UspA family [Pseudomonadota bacterium]|jgi:nucleotide-binding universal stress UspA family protein
MFKTILVPTDGSALSEKAVKLSLQFAKSINAKVVGLNVVEPYHVLSVGVEMVSDTREVYERDSKLRAAACLAKVEDMARSAGVSCECISAMDDHPWEAITKTANSKGCDLIAMASHGYRGVQGLLLGSQTNHVLTHSKIPVLVFR